MSGKNPFSNGPVGAAAFAETESEDNPFENNRQSVPSEPEPAYGGGKRLSAAEARKANSTATHASPPRAVASDSSGGGAFAGASEEDLRLREENLKRREAELEAREKKVDTREAELKANPLYREPNWPSRCYPIAYHDIDVEVPEQHRSLVRRFYWMCIITWIALFWNWLIFLVAFFDSNNTISVDTDVLWSSIYLVLGIPGSWKLWYGNVYSAVGGKSNAQWVAFFISFGAHWILTILIGVAVPSMNGAGLLFMLRCFTESWTLGGVFSLVNTVIWGLLLIGATFYGKKAYAIWKDGGGSERLARETAAAKAMGSVAMSGVSTQQ